MLRTGMATARCSNVPTATVIPKKKKKKTQNKKSGENKNHQKPQKTPENPKIRTPTNHYTEPFRFVEGLGEMILGLVVLLVLLVGG